jgi:SAM-dependent methyltransferase/GNAT superfamily N-acetyltransferase
MKIVRAAPTQAAELTHIALAAKRHWQYPEQWIEAWRPALTITPDYIAAHEVYMLLDGDKPVGFYALSADTGMRQLDHLWLEPAAIGRGYGRALLQHAGSRARESGVRLLEIESDPNARGFYEKLGAHVIGEHQTEIDGQRRVLPVLQLDLIRMAERRLIDLQNTYDRVADEYARRIFDELKDKPFDRDLLDRFAARLNGAGVVCDMGCGPGQIARYLHDRGLTVVGVDLSSSMIKQARRLNPDLEFQTGNMLSLNVEDEAWAGIAAFYSIIHIPRAQVIAALCELRRVLRGGGLLLLAFHVGNETLHLDEWWGHAVAADFEFFDLDEMQRYLAAAGFEIEEAIEREPYLEVEHQSRRGYCLAHKPINSGNRTDS